MKIIARTLSLLAILACGCAEKVDESRIWEIRSQRGDETVVIFKTNPDPESLSKEAKNAIRSEVNLDTAKSNRISLVRKPESGVTDTIGPYWLEKNGDNISLREIESYSDSGELISSPLATANTTVESMVGHLIYRIDKALETTHSMPNENAN